MDNLNTSSIVKLITQGPACYIKQLQIKINETLQIFVILEVHLFFATNNIQY